MSLGWQKMGSLHDFTRKDGGFAIKK